MIQSNAQSNAQVTGQPQQVTQPVTQVDDVDDESVVIEWDDEDQVR